MAGRVKVDVVEVSADTLVVIPRLCPAAEGMHAGAPNCLHATDGHPLALCPLLYCTETAVEGIAVRHADVSAAVLDVCLYPHHRGKLRVLCLAAPAKDTPPGAGKYV